MAAKVRDRPHWIVLRGGLLLAAVLSAAAVPWQLWSAFRSDDLTWDGDIGYGTAVPQSLVASNPGTQLYFDGHVGVYMHDASDRLRLLSVAPDVLLAAAMSYVAWVMLLVVLNVNAGRPFHGAVPRLLHTLAPVIAATAVAFTLLSAYVNQEIMVAALRPSGPPSGPDSTYSPDIGQMISAGCSQHCSWA
jgi:hypothetical protein